jgi:hypothetical protein
MVLYYLSGDCHNSILGYSLKFTFFNIKKKCWQCGENKPGNTTVILEEMQGLIVPYYAKK